jgi:hypothetical protein
VRVQLKLLVSNLTVSTQTVSLQLPEDGELGEVTIIISVAAQLLVTNPVSYITAILTFNQTIDATSSDTVNDVATVIHSARSDTATVAVFTPGEKVFQGERLYLHLVATEAVSCRAVATIDFGGGTAKGRDQRGRFVRA